MHWEKIRQSDKVLHVSHTNKPRFFSSYVQDVGVKQYEPKHDKTSKVTCALSEDSDKPARLRSLIRVFADRLKKLWVLGYLKNAQQRLWPDFLNAAANWSESSLCANVIV